MRPNQFAAILAAGTSTPGLRFATPFNRRQNSTATATATQKRMWIRYKVTLGSDDFADLRVCLSGTILTSSGDASLGNAYTVEKCALEKETGGAASTPVLWSGSRTVTVPDGTIEVVSDPVLPSAFSLSQFPRGGVYWIRLLLSVTTSGHKFPICAIPQVSPNVTLVYDPVTTGISDIDGTGQPSYSAGSGGSGPTDFTFPNSAVPILVGTPKTTAGKFIAGLGDSIVFQLSDANNQLISSFFGRSLWDADLASNPRAGCNFGFSGSNASMWLSAPTSTDLLKYANVTVEEFGTNGAQYSNSAAIWATAKALGHMVIRTKLLTVTTSTDGWATTANQTKLAAWTTPTGDRAILNAQFAAQEGIGFDKFVSFDADVLHTDRDIWKAGATADGTHPLPTYHALMATTLRSAYAAL